MFGDCQFVADEVRRGPSQNLWDLAAVSDWLCFLVEWVAGGLPRHGHSSVNSPPPKFVRKCPCCDDVQGKRGACVGSPFLLWVSPKEPQVPSRHVLEAMFRIAVEAGALREGLPHQR